ncbi:developmental pluripotency-associated protein 3-like [Eubalaena glacialis]|uniref:developmental pluripotency-associated protein 3-like n=1 Tax=Eubalaena glacialis TaxID=27606 RepID=UPI002A5AB6E2|nr:developmental pluripotency-associated protein 3-like [Eubalaena glacialis]
MDSSEVNPTWTLESPQMSIDENSQAIPVASQPMSEVFIKNLCNLTLNPSTKLSFILPECLPQPTGRLLGENIPYRRAVRTVLTDRREKMEGLIQSIKKRYGKGVPWSDSQREPQQNDTETRSREQRFRCSCRFCWFRKPSEDNYENYYNNKYYSNYYDRHRVEGAINLILDRMARVPVLPVAWEGGKCQTGQEGLSPQDSALIDRSSPLWSPLEFKLFLQRDNPDSPTFTSPVVQKLNEDIYKYRPCPGSARAVAAKAPQVAKEPSLTSLGAQRCLRPTPTS